MVALLGCGDPAALPAVAADQPVVAAPASDPPLAETPATEVAPEEPAAPDNPEPEISAGLVSFTGTWSSSECGARSYPREVTLVAGGTYNGRDLVSPCPPNARCVWSGVVTFGGTWRQDGAVVGLSEERVDQGQLAKARPSELHFDPITTRLYEQDGQGRCYYESGSAQPTLRPVPRPQ